MLQIDNNFQSDECTTLQCYSHLYEKIPMHIILSRISESFIRIQEPLTQHFISIHNIYFVNQKKN